MGKRAMDKAIDDKHNKRDPNSCDCCGATLKPGEVFICGECKPNYDAWLDEYMTSPLTPEEQEALREEALRASRRRRR